MLLEARDEIVRLTKIISASPPSAQTPEFVDLVTPGSSPEHNVEDIYQQINQELHEVAILRELRKKHGQKAQEEKVQEEKVQEEKNIDTLTEQLQNTKLEAEDIDLSCPICLTTLNTDPDSELYTGCCIGNFCGHALCETCWKQYRSRRNKNCPVCRQLLFLGRGRPPKANVW